MSEKENPGLKGSDKLPQAKAPCEVIYTWGNKSYVGTSTHFHEKGMLIFCRQPAPLNERVKVTLRFPDFKNVLEMEAEVVWTNIHGPSDTFRPRAMGVKFLNVERDAERLLAELASQYEAHGSIYSCYYT
ncbi:MAG TPA: PilZ domain-containing protein [Syntrophobacteraceae bacterium]|nr:PilZ domain-containing protein [Syntrophobacteraceae bacterium]